MNPDENQQPGHHPDNNLGHQSHGVSLNPIPHPAAAHPITPDPATTPAPAPPPQQPQYAQPQYVQPQQVPPGPQPSPVFTSTVPASAPAHHNPTSAGLIVLQWLTYAFWGWTVLILSFLTATVVTSLISETSVGGATTYAIAGILVLLPISLVCDFLYSKKEPIKKTGAESVVMVIHAVLFALFAIGTLILAAFCIVQLLTSSTDSKAIQISLISSLIVTVFYAVTFLRTLSPSNMLWIRKAYKLFMLVSVAIITVLGIIGPVALERTTRNDRLIVASLPTVQQEISNYARTNKKLPASLDTLTLDGDAKKLVDNNLATYKPESSITDSTLLPLSSNNLSGTELSSSLSSLVAYKYQLCVTYKKKSDNYNASRSNITTYAAQDEYSTYVDTYNHPEGNVCYKLRTTNY